MYVYWLKPKTRPFHDQEQTDDRPVMTFDIDAKMGNGGNDIESELPRRVVSCILAKSESQFMFGPIGMKTGENKRYWFKRPGDTGRDGAANVYPFPVSTEGDDDNGELENELKGGYVQILSNYGYRPFYYLNGEVNSADERLTLLFKGPHSSKDVPDDVKDFGIGPQEYVELMANKAWGICSNTWTTDFDCED